MKNEYLEYIEIKKSFYENNGRVNFNFMKAKKKVPIRIVDTDEDWNYRFVFPEHK